MAKDAAEGTPTTALFLDSLLDERRSAGLEDDRDWQAKKASGCNIPRPA